MKSYFILGLLAAASSIVAGSDYKKAIFEINEAFPGIIAGTPEVIKVVFDNGAFLDLGKNITPTEAKNEPFVDWNADKDAYYTLIVVDPDAPFRQDSYMKEVVTWLVGNIPGKDTTAGDVLVEYVGTAAPRNMSPNRFFYFIFRQFNKIPFFGKRVNKYTFDGRANFSTQDFVKKYELGYPVGVNFLTTFYDPQTKVLFRQLNCCEELLFLGS